MQSPLRCILTAPPTQSIPRVISASGSSTRTFSSTSQNLQRVARHRRAMYAWLNSQGENFRNPLPGSTNYLSAYNNAGQLRRLANGDSPSGEDSNSTGRSLPREQERDLRPFPLNPLFSSQSVLSEELRLKIWESIMTQGKSVREVSALYGVEMHRVGAVVRLMEIEKEWQRIGKPFARPYAEAVMAMLPKTDLKGTLHGGHESINDLPVHSATGQQIFYPTSESRHFTRADAAKVFDENLLPADDRVPHPELAQLHRDVLADLSPEVRQSLAEKRAVETEKRDRWRRERKAKADAEVKRVERKTCEFRFTEINVEDAGKDGRGPKGTGWRYGTPLMDRKRGHVRIPTRV